MPCPNRYSVFGFEHGCPPNSGPRISIEPVRDHSSAGLDLPGHILNGEGGLRHLDPEQPGPLRERVAYVLPKGFAVHDSEPTV